MQTILHEDFVAQFFVAANEAAICKALGGRENLQNALNYFEDTRTEQQVNNMLQQLKAITKVQYVWDDELEAYYIKN